MENPIKMDDLVVPLFLETSIYTLEVQGKTIKRIRNFTKWGLFF